MQRAVGDSVQNPPTYLSLNMLDCHAYQCVHSHTFMAGFPQSNVTLCRINDEMTNKTHFQLKLDARKEDLIT